MTWDRADTVGHYAETLGIHTVVWVNTDTVFAPMDVGAVRVGERLSMRYASRRALELHIAALCDLLKDEDELAPCTCGDNLRPGQHRQIGACLILAGDGA